MRPKTLQSIIRFLIKAISRTTYIGLENVPASGGVIIATNHLSQIDNALLFANPARADITALVTTKYQKHAAIRWIVNTAGAIWIDRDIADFNAVRAAARALAEGRALGIAPEGTRSLSGELLEGKPGTLLLAVKSGAPIVPVAIWGSEDAGRKLKALHRPVLTVRFGQPFTIPPIARGEHTQALQHWTDELMCRIAAMLPEKYRGFYKEHPRLKELLKAG